MIPKKLEEFASGNTETMRSVLRQTEQHGLIAHRSAISTSPWSYAPKSL